ncbi:hypothetical protein HGA89_00095 [bacterium]|nr:hypothetical protein [bacterium]
MKLKKNPEAVVREIKRQTRRKFSAEEKIRIILEGLKGEESIAELCPYSKPHPVMTSAPKTAVRSLYGGASPTTIDGATR